MNETGKVVAVDPDALWIEARRESTCGSCAAQKGCGQSALSRLYPERSNYLRVTLPPLKATETYQPGDMVEFSVPDGSVLLGSFLVYLLPIFALLGGVLLGREIFSHELLSLLLAVLAMTGCYFWLRRRLEPKAGQSHFEPELIGLVTPHDATPDNTQLLTVAP